MGFLSKFIGQVTGSDGAKLASDPSYSETLTRLEKLFDGIEEKEAQYLAALGMLLGRVAYADLEISEGERDKIKDILLNRCKLSDQKADAVLSLVVELTLSQHTESHLVIRQLVETTDRNQRIEVMRALFFLAGDEDISNEENSEISIIAKGLGFAQKEFIAIRSEFRDQLSVLK